MNDMAATWKTIWKRIDARHVELGLTWRQVERLGRVSQRTLYKMRDDGTPLESPHKRASLCAVLEWTPDSIDRLLAGKEPAGRRTNSGVSIVTSNTDLALVDRVEVLEGQVIEMGSLLRALESTVESNTAKFVRIDARADKDRAAAQPWVASNSKRFTQPTRKPKTTQPKTTQPKEPFA